MPLLALKLLSISALKKSSQCLLRSVRENQDILTLSSAGLQSKEGRTAELKIWGHHCSREERTVRSTDNALAGVEGLWLKICKTTGRTKYMTEVYLYPNTAICPSPVPLHQSSLWVISACFNLFCQFYRWKYTVIYNLSWVHKLMSSSHFP